MPWKNYAKKLEPRSLKGNPYRPRRGGLINVGPQKEKRGQAPQPNRIETRIKVLR